MRRAMIVVAVVMGLAGQVGIAKADWRFTKWGMSEAKFKQAAKREGLGIEPWNSQTSDETGFKGKTTAGGNSFDVIFVFRRDGLYEVHMTMIPYDWVKCSASYSQILEQYGAPSEAKPANSPLRASWVSERTGTVIHFGNIENSRICAVVYRRLGAGDF